jgi:hypothetical protein
VKLRFASALQTAKAKHHGIHAFHQRNEYDHLALASFVA